MKVEQANYIKAIFTAVFAFLSALLGVLAVPVILLVVCNLIDYATGLMASKYRAQDINSYKSIRGIFKKVSMWLLVVVGAIIDAESLTVNGKDIMKMIEDLSGLAADAERIRKLEESVQEIIEALSNAISA